MNTFIRRIPWILAAVHSLFVASIAVQNVVEINKDPSFIEDAREIWSQLFFVIDLPLSLVAALLMTPIERVWGQSLSDPFATTYFAPLWFLFWGGVNWYGWGLLIRNILREPPAVHE